MFLRRKIYGYNRYSYCKKIVSNRTNRYLYPKAEKAAADAERAASESAQAIENINSITEQTNENNEKSIAALDRVNESLFKADENIEKTNIALNNADESLSKANESLSKADESLNKANESLATIEEDLQQIDEAIDKVINFDDTLIESLDKEIDKIEAEPLSTSQNESSSYGFKLKLPSGKEISVTNINKIYNKIGENTDGSMTQKAITDAINSISPSEEIIFDKENAGSLIMVNKCGKIIPSSISESNIVALQIANGMYNNDVLGIEIDYTNKTVTRLGAAKNFTPGSNFDKFKMFGGRKRCIVNQTGEIVRFLNSLDDESTVSDERIMVYQPAFYYLRNIIETTQLENGTKIAKEQLYLSDLAIPGFSLHPLFKDNNDKDLKYVLIPAFESSAYRASSSIYEKNDPQNLNFSEDMLVSVINAKPISGSVQSFTITNAEKMAQNNGPEWHITNLEFESMNQMLMIVEFGALNIQSSFNQGLVNLTSSSELNIASNTGSTLILGNGSDQAEETINILNGFSTVYTDEGKCSISYRGMENPFGNSWRFIRGLTVKNNVVTYNDTELSFKLPTTSDWVNGFGYDKVNNWIFLPIEVGKKANSLQPIGDYFNSAIDENTSCEATIGGYAASATNGGIFYYSFSNKENESNSKDNSARIMYVPVAGSTIETNSYNLWSKQR